MEAPSRLTLNTTYLHIVPDGFYFYEGQERSDLALHNLRQIQKVLSEHIPFSTLKLKKIRKVSCKLGLAYPTFPSRLELQKKILQIAHHDYEIYSRNASTSPILKLIRRLPGLETEADTLFNQIQEIIYYYHPSASEEKNEKHTNKAVMAARLLGWQGRNKDAPMFLYTLKQTLYDLEKDSVLRGLDGWDKLSDEGLIYLLKLVKHEYNFHPSALMSKTTEYLDNANFRGVIVIGLVFGFNLLWNRIVIAIEELIDKITDKETKREFLAYYLQCTPLKQILRDYPLKLIGELIDNQLVTSPTDIAAVFQCILKEPRPFIFDRTELIHKLCMSGVDLNHISIVNGQMAPLPFIFHLISFVNYPGKQLLDYLFHNVVGFETTINGSDTPLIYALRANLASAAPESLIYLLDAGVKVNYKDSRGFSPLYYAIKRLFDTYSNQEKEGLLVIKKILDTGADITADKAQLISALYQAHSYSEGSIRIIETLAGWGLDLHETDSQGRTIMDYATQCGSLTLAKALLRLNVYGSHANQQILLHIAHQVNDPEALDLFQTCKLL